MSRLPFRLGPVLFLAAIFYIGFVSRVMLAPLLPILEPALGLGHGEAGLLFLALALGYSTGLLASGWVSARLGHRRTIAFSSVTVGLAALGMAIAPSILWLALGYGLLGAFSGLYLPSGVATLTDQTREAHWGKVIGIHELAPNLGYITAPLLAEVLLRIVSWRGVLGTIGSLALLLGGLYGWRGQGSDRRGEPPSLATLRLLASEPPLWVAAAIFAVSIGAVLGLYMMMPLFLVNELGLTREWANTIIGLSRLSGLVAVLGAGVITDRIGTRRALVLVLTCTGSLTILLGLLRGPLATPVLVFLHSAACASFFPAGFALVSQLVAPEHRSVAVSVVTLLGFLFGGGAVPSAVGIVAEAYSFASAFTGVGVLVLLCVAPLLRLRPAPSMAKQL